MQPSTHMSVRRVSLALLVALSTLPALTRPVQAAPGANSPFAGMSQREMWCQVLEQGISSPARKAHAREECYGKLARFDKVGSWQGEITLTRHYTCADQSGTKTVRARFGLKRTPYVSNAQVTSAIKGQAPAAATVFQQGMARMPGAKVVIRRDPTTGYLESPSELSWFLTTGKLDASIGTHGSDGGTTHSENGSGSASISKQARLIFDLEQGTWSLELPPVDEKGFPVTLVTSSQEGTTTEHDRESLDDLNSLDGFTSDHGLNKLPGNGLQLVGHVTTHEGDCERDELTWRLVPAANCGAYKDLEVAIEAPDGNAHWVFDTKDAPARFGPYRVVGDAYYTKGPHGTVLADIHDMLQWDLPEVPGVTRRVEPANLHGSPITITYAGMPAKNSAFGQVQLSASLPDLGGCAAPENRHVGLFFARDGRGNPKGKQEPNWFYYWMQTKAGDSRPSGEVVYQPLAHSGKQGGCGSDDFGYFLPRYPFSAVVQICPLANGDSTSPDRYGEVALGIDQFALTVRHELIHKRLYDDGLRAFDIAWYHKYGMDYDLHKGYAAARRKLDPDGDGLTGAEEQKYGLNPLVKDTHCTGENDNEYLAYMLSSKQWKLGSADDQDWACPGRQCGGVGPSPGGGHWAGCPAHRTRQKTRHASGDPPGQSGSQMRSLSMSTPGPSPSNPPRATTGDDVAAPAAPGSARIQNDLKSHDPMTRLRAVRDLAASGGGPAPGTSAKQILGAFAIELEGPGAPAAIHNGYLPQGAWRRVQYARLSAELSDKALAVIYQHYLKASGTMKNWLAITLGDAGDARVTRPLIVLSHQASDWPTRWAAVEALGAIGSPEAIRALEDVMRHDGATTTMKTDVRGATTFYPVREQAAGALMRLGIKIHLIGPDIYVVDKSAPNAQPSVVR